MPGTGGHSDCQPERRGSALTKAGNLKGRDDGFPLDVLSLRSEQRCKPAVQERSLDWTQKLDHGGRGDTPGNMKGAERGPVQKSKELHV